MHGVSDEQVKTLAKMLFKPRPGKSLAGLFFSFLLALLASNSYDAHGSGTKEFQRNSRTDCTVFYAPVKATI